MDMVVIWVMRAKGLKLGSESESKKERERARASKREINRDEEQARATLDRTQELVLDT